MTLQTWLFFVAAEGVLCFTPGPAVLIVISLGLNRGRKAGLHASAGVALANAGYFLLSATGLGALLLASWELFVLIKWIGAVYLCWIGFSMVLAKARRGAESRDGAAPAPTKGALLHGFVAQGANPKALMFFVALLPQFVRPDQPLVPQIVILAVTSIVIEMTALATYSVLAGRAQTLATGGMFGTTLQRVGGGLMIAAGLGMATMDPPTVESMPAE